MPVHQRPSPRSETLFVAASDSNYLDKKYADYICDGTDDDVQVQAALDRIDADILTSGSVLLSRGTFTVGSVVSINSDNLTMKGKGMGITTIMAKNAFTTDQAILETGTGSVGYVSLSDFTINGNKAGQTTQNHDGLGLYGGGVSIRVTNVEVKYMNYVNNSWAGIYVSPNSSTDVVIDSCRIIDCEGEGIEVDWGRYSKIINNNISGCGAAGIYIYESSSLISGNTITGGSSSGIYLYWSNGTSYHQPFQVSNNFISGNAYQAIALSGISGANISNNFISSWDGGIGVTDNVYDGILLLNGATRNVISDNVITQETTDTAHNFQYGIRESAAEDDYNIITNNQVLDGQTGRISSNGANSDVSHNITA
jgi:hypothetical protein